MNQPEFDPAEEAIVEGIDSASDVAPGRFLSERLEDTRLEWDVETSGRSFLVVADSFLPGWTATVDGMPAPIRAVYGCVRGISIGTAGRHQVEMSFVPRTLPAGLGGTGIGLLLLGVLWPATGPGRFNRLPLLAIIASKHLVDDIQRPLLHFVEHRPEILAQNPEHSQLQASHK